MGISFRLPGSFIIYRGGNGVAICVDRLSSGALVGEDRSPCGRLVCH